jgi:DNA-directed RNA polymerase specialized sigma24 family protein
MQRFSSNTCQSNATYLMIDHFKLVKNCLKGKLEAQKQLYEHFACEMLAVCYRYTKSTPDAEDVLQDGFVKVFTHLHQYKADGEIGAWVRN